MLPYFKFISCYLICAPINLFCVPNRFCSKRSKHNNSLLIFFCLCKRGVNAFSKSVSKSVNKSRSFCSFFVQNERDFSTNKKRQALHVEKLTASFIDNQCLLSFVSFSFDCCLSCCQSCYRNAEWRT